MGLGMHWDSIKSLEDVGPVRAEWGRVQLNYSKTWPWLPGYKDRPSGAAWGRFGPSRAELGMHWGFNSITLRLGPWLQG